MLVQKYTESVFKLKPKISELESHLQNVKDDLTALNDKVLLLFRRVYLYVGCKIDYNLCFLSSGYWDVLFCSSVAQVYWPNLSKRRQPAIWERKPLTKNTRWTNFDQAEISSSNIFFPQGHYFTFTSWPKQSSWISWIGQTTQVETQRMQPGC